MPEIGARCVLRVVGEVPAGLNLDGENLGNVLLPRREAPAGVKAGDCVEVQVRKDFTGRTVATTQLPKACVGEFSCFRVVGFVPHVGAYLDWGNGEQLLLPASECGNRVRPGDRIVAAVVRHAAADKLVATARLDRLLNQTPPPYVPGQRVHLLVAAESPLGYRAIIENAHWGLIYKTAIGSPLIIGSEHDGFVKLVRPDGKIDLALDATGYRRIGPLAEKILEKLKQAGGRLNYSDESSPAAIRGAFGVSKTAFKQAIGALFRHQHIRIEPDCIVLVGDGSGTSDEGEPERGGDGR